MKRRIGLRTGLLLGGMTAGVGLGAVGWMGGFQHGFHAKATPQADATEVRKQPDGDGAFTQELLSGAITQAGAQVSKLTITDRSGTSQDVVIPNDDLAYETGLSDKFTNTLHNALSGVNAQLAKEFVQEANAILAPFNN